MTVLYRYLRPVAYHFDRNEICAVPEGGVCFRLTLLQESCYSVSYAVCGENVKFSRKTAKKMADARQPLLTIELTETDSISVANAVLNKITAILQVQSTGFVELPFADLCQISERTTTCAVIQKILSSIDEARTLALHNNDAISALHISKSYKDLK